MPDFKTFCPRCKQTKPGEVRHIPTTLAWHNHCQQCGHDWVGEPEPCLHCNAVMAGTNSVEVEHIPPDWHVPSATECVECVQERAYQAFIVSGGGAYFRCGNCWVEGVAPLDSALARYVRERVKPPLEVRAELAYCPKCNPPVRVQ